MIVDGMDQKTIRGVTVSGVKKDGWTNLLAGFGRKKSDKTENTYYGDYPRFTDSELTSLYVGEGVGAQIVDKAANDMTRQGFVVGNDDDQKITKELNRLKVTTHMNKALKWARLYRGAVIVMIPDRALDDMSTPMPVNAPIKMLRTYSAARIVVNSTDIIEEPSSEYFDDVEIFNIQKRNGTPMRVHRSRCLVFKGIEAPDDNQELDLQNRYWGLSILQRVWSRLSNFGGIEKGVANLMMEVVVGKYTLSNLAQILSQNDDASLELVYNRIDIINASKSLINAVLLGEGEKYERDTANISGIPDVMDRFMTIIAAVADYPVTRLWGVSPAGENSTGESDMRIYYDSIKSEQGNKLKDPLQMIVDRVAVTEKRSGEHEVTFNPLWQPTEKEKAEVYKANADGDKIYLETGVLTPEEVTLMRFPALREEV